MVMSDTYRGSRACWYARPGATLPAPTEPNGPMDGLRSFGSQDAPRWLPLSSKGKCLGWHTAKAAQEVNPASCHAAETAAAWPAELCEPDVPRLAAKRLKVVGRHNCHAGQPLSPGGPDGGVCNTRTTTALRWRISIHSAEQERSKTWLAAPIKPTHQVTTREDSSYGLGLVTQSYHGA